ncbi:UNVERIFIED_CONTAM: hypothetical protein NCL1_30917 [Trichonephila clavipes]
MRFRVEFHNNLGGKLESKPEKISLRQKLYSSRSSYKLSQVLTSREPETSFSEISSVFTSFSSPSSSSVSSQTSGGNTTI